MVLQIAPVGLGVPDAIDDTRSDNSILHRLIGFGFKVSCQMGVIPDGRGRVHEVLRVEEGKQRPVQLLDI